MRPNIRFLAERAKLLRDLRSFFDDLGFLEVQPPCMSRDCVIDAYIDPISVPAAQLACPSAELPPQLYLQTSPELSMKRLLAAGAPSIYSIGPVFRAGEQGRLHNPEFTMLEWYEVGANMDKGVTLLGHLVSRVLDQSGYDVCTYRQVFQRELGFDPIDSPLEKLQSQASIIDMELAKSIANDRDAMLDVIFSNLIQPKLGHSRPQIVTDYPVSQAALAKPSSIDDQCSARFELFAKGTEIANGYDELLDAEILIERAHASNAKRSRGNRVKLEVENALVSAMRDGLPPCAGVALGVDRLLMICVGADSIEEVIPLPIEIA